MIENLKIWNFYIERLLLKKRKLDKYTTNPKIEFYIFYVQ